VDQISFLLLRSTSCYIGTGEAHLAQSMVDVNYIELSTVGYIVASKAMYYKQQITSYANAALITYL